MMDKETKDAAQIIYNRLSAGKVMLAALKEISAWVPSAGPDEPGGMSIMEAIDIADAAIAKAEAAGIRGNWS